jgi:hypothetical protein
MATASTLMTAEELDALPEDGTDRWLIAGVLRERTMTRRNRFHSRVTNRVGKLLDNWLDAHPIPGDRSCRAKPGSFSRAIRIPRWAST